MTHETVMLTAVRSTKDCIPTYYDEILRSLAFGFDEGILDQLTGGKVLLNPSESLDLDPADIRLPVRIQEVYFNDGILDSYVQHEVWVDVKEAPRPSTYLHDLNRGWELAEAHFRGLKGIVKEAA